MFAIALHAANHRLRTFVRALARNASVCRDKPFGCCEIFSGAIHATEKDFASPDELTPAARERVAAAVDQLARVLRPA